MTFDPAAIAQNVEVKTSVNLHVRTVKQGVLITDITLPAGSVVSVNVSEFEKAHNYKYWAGENEKQDQFVGKIEVISAPGISPAEIAQLNSESQDLFMAKSYLGDSYVVTPPPPEAMAPNSGSTEEIRPVGRGARVTISQPAPVYRNDPSEETGSFPRKNDIGPESASQLVDQIDHSNETVKKAGTAGSYCPGCEKSMYKKWIEQGLPEKALSESLEMLRKNPRGAIRNQRFLTITDFTKPSREKRMYVLDLQTGRMEKYLTSNGHGSETVGVAHSFGNSVGSNLTPPGFHVTGIGIHYGKHGESLILNGLEARNNNSTRRPIEIHEGWYVSDKFVAQYGRTGHSEGCLAVDKKVIHQLIDELKGGSLVYNYTGK